MYDTFLKLIREELSSRTLAKLTPVKLDEYRSSMHSILASLIKSPESSILIEKMISNVARDAELWARFRFAKLILGADKPDETFDTLILEKLSRIIDAYVNIVNGLNITYGDAILVRYSRDLLLPKGSRKKGDYEFVKIENILMLPSIDIYDTVPYLTVKYLKNRNGFKSIQK
ncbi:MAG: hypothetical protein QXF34_00495 [Desulfurococcaceae archaeon]